MPWEKYRTQWRHTRTHSFQVNSSEEAIFYVAAVKSSLCIVKKKIPHCLYLPFYRYFTRAVADFSKVVEIVRYAREMMVHTDGGSCCNQPHCLTAVFLPVCLGGWWFMWWSLHPVLWEGQPPNRLEQLNSTFFFCHNQPSNVFLRQHKTTHTEKNDPLPPKGKNISLFCMRKG